MRGGGRGFGRGWGRSDHYVTREDQGPPPLFPNDFEQPQRREADDPDQLMARWRSMGRFWQHSPYHLATPQIKAGGMKQRLEDFLGDTKPKAESVNTRGLAAVLTLHPKYVPQELYTNAEQRASARAANVEAQKAIWAKMHNEANDAAGLSMEQMQQLEANQKDNEEAAAKEEEAEIEEISEPDEDDFEDDDYLQGQEYDDDDGYDNDPGDDGDGGGDAFF